MPLTTIITNPQQRVKDSYAASPTVGLVVRANGEENVSIIDQNGNVYQAGFPAPASAPTATVSTASGSALPAGQFCAYLYVYASSQFPFVENANAINGKLWPRSNPSPAVTVTLNATLASQVNGTVMGTTQPGIDTIWLFRSTFFATLQEAQAAGAGGQVFFNQQLVNPGTATAVAFNDNTLADGTDEVEEDNYVSAQFQFCIYYDPYWWGFGNLPFSAPVSWANTGGGGSTVVTLTSGLPADKWFTGRNGQNITLTGVTTGGIDGKGTYLFLWLSNTTCAITLDGVTPATIAPSNGTVNIQGPATTLYRSKPRNPFAWGYTQTIGQVNVPQQYAFKVGGGLGTAIAVVPNFALLKLDTEFPAQCFTLNLRAAGTSAFEPSLRIISDVYSVSAHFSQFAAVTPQGYSVLWGWDCKNFCIVQCDGITQIPVSLPIPKTLRGLSTNRTQQLLAHGLYDPQSELNCIWVPTNYGISLVDLLIYQHAPTGFWGFVYENDVLCSAALQDTTTNQVKTFVGTQSGLMGQAFVPNAFANWLPQNGVYTGVIGTATANSITLPTSTLNFFNTTDNGILGNWVLVTDASNGTEQYARISAVTNMTITFDWIRSFTGGGTTAFNPVPSTGGFFYIGLIECRLFKLFDLGAPSTDKSLTELWLSQQNVDPTTCGTLVRFYREYESTYSQFATVQNQFADGTNSDVWFNETDIPSELLKVFGIEVINRGYQQWRFINMVLKPNMAP